MIQILLLEEIRIIYVFSVMSNMLAEMVVLHRYTKDCTV